MQQEIFRIRVFISSVLYELEIPCLAKTFKLIMEEFKASEEYRKYLIELQFDNINLYTVWGTDMADKETDKLLVVDTKVVAFRETNQLKHELKDIVTPFVDDTNFRNWVEHEDLSTVYNTNDLTLLSNFKLSFLNDKATSLSVLTDINLIQDFAIQVNHLELLSIFEQVTMANLKDFIYDNHFWKGGDKNKTALKRDEVKITTMCNDLYTAFYNSM